MIGQLLMTGPLFLMFIYAWIEYKRSWLVGIATIVFSGLALICVWFPGFATDAASFLGLGSGSDLLLYCWVGIAFVVLLSLHLKNRIQMQVTTTLARQIAIADRRTSSNEPPPGHGT